MSSKQENYGINIQKGGYHRLNTAYTYTCPQIDKIGFQTPSAFLCPDPSAYEKYTVIQTGAGRLTSSECENFHYNNK